MSDNKQAVVTPEIEAEAKKGLKAWFAKPKVKQAAKVIVPGALAALLFPILGPAAAGVPGAIAVQNGLEMFGVKWSGATLVKIVQGQPLDESDMRNILKDMTKEDPQVNKEAAATLTAAASTVVEAVKESPHANREELASMLSTNMAEQGGALEKIATDYDKLLRLDGAEFEKALEVLHNRLNIIQSQVAEGEGSLIEGSGQGVRGNPTANTSQEQKAKEGGQIKNSKQIVDFK